MTGFKLANQRNGPQEDYEKSPQEPKTPHLMFLARGVKRIREDEFQPSIMMMQPEDDDAGINGEYAGMAA